MPALLLSSESLLMPSKLTQAAASLALLALAACSTMQPPLSTFEPTSAEDTLSARNAKTLGWLTVAGQPTEADLARLAETGTGCVINMRTPDEMAEVEFDEAAAAEALGMRYVNLPVSGVDSLTDDLMGEARDVLRTCSDTGVLLH
ncbi:MAG: sulfur transferase domain-containing protein [Planctomycetota bacterium]